MTLIRKTLNDDNRSRGNNPRHNETRKATLGMSYLHILHPPSKDRIAMPITKNAGMKPRKLRIPKARHRNKLKTPTRQRPEPPHPKSETKSMPLRTPRQIKDPKTTERDTRETTEILKRPNPTCVAQCDHACFEEGGNNFSYYPTQDLR